MCISAIMGGASLLGGLFGMSSADKAADAQIAAAQQANDLQLYMYENNLELMQPWLTGGQNALNAYLYELGLGPKPTPQSYSIDQRSVTTPGTPSQVVSSGMGEPVYNPTTGMYTKSYTTPGTPSTTSTEYWVGDRQFDTYDDAQGWIDSQPSGYYTGFEATPAYQFQLEQGTKAIENMAAARGMSLSGATLKEASRYNQGLASQEYNNYLNRLAGTSGMGQSAAANTANYGINYANQAGNNYLNAGNAAASGYANQSNMLNSTLGDMSSILMMGQMGVF